MSVIHETVIKTIVDILSDLKEVKGSSLEQLGKNFKNGRSMKSIAQASNELTLTYPCLVSNTLSIESCAMISKAMERKNAQMLQLLLGAWQSQSLNAGEEFNPIAYLKQYHNNLNIDYNVTVDSALDTVDKIIKLTEEAGFNVEKTPVITESEQIKILKENRTREITLPDSINESPIVNYKVKKINGRLDIIQEKKNYNNNNGKGNSRTNKNNRPNPNIPTALTNNLGAANPSRGDTNKLDYYSKAAKHADFLANQNVNPALSNRYINDVPVVPSEADKKVQQYAKVAKDMEYAANNDGRAKEQHDWNKEKHEWEKDNQNWNVEYHDKQMEKIKQDIEFGKNREDRDAEYYKYQKTKIDDDIKFNRNRDAREQSRELRDIEKHNASMRSGRIKDTLTMQQLSQGGIAQLQNVDVKKANELVGTPIMVTVHIARGEGQIDALSFLIAVKSKMYPLESKDIINRIINKNKDKNFFGKLIKVATGEISFVKDFLFAIDGAKLDALSQSRKGSSSKLWRVLERTALKSKVTRALGKNNDCMSISTLVISQDEVEYIKKYANIDMDKEQYARVILDAYNLLCLVIVDETNEVAKFLFNTGQDLFEELSFNQLEREATDGSYKKMVNLITKMK